MKFRRNFWTETEGGRAQFKRVYDLFFNELFAFSERQIQTTKEARDIVQIAFQRLIMHKGSFPNDQVIRIFLFIVVKNLGIDYLRKIGSELQRKEEWWLTQPELTEDDYRVDDVRYHLIKRLMKEIDDLPVGCGAVFKLHYFEELCNEEIATRLAITDKTVRNQLYTAKKTLKGLFDKGVIKFSQMMIL